MSQPLFFVDPDTNEVKKVVEAEVVSLAQIDEQIAHHQNRISELNVEREKVVTLLGGNSDSSNSAENAQPEQPAQPETPAEAPVVAEATPAPTPTDQVQNVEQLVPATPASPEADPTVAQDIPTPPISA